MKFKLCTVVCLFGICVQAQMPPTNPVVRKFVGPRKVWHVEPTVEFTWEPYTNVWIEISSSTNLASTNWVFFTNLPISATSFRAPLKQPIQFFRQRVIINDLIQTNQ